MGFFLRSKKKVKKESPKSQAKDPRRELAQPRPLPPPPTQASRSRCPNSPYQQLASFQPAGLLPAPPGWNAGLQQPAPYHQYGPYPPVIVNQHHYYLGSPPPQSQAGPFGGSPSLSKLNLGSAVDLAKEVYQGSGIPQLLDEVLPSWHNCGSQLVRQGNGLVDEISHRFDNVLTSIDQGGYNGKEHDIFAWELAQPSAQSSPKPLVSDNGMPKASRKAHGKDYPKGQTTAAAAVVSGSFFAKVDHYANSRLPMNLPPLKLYIPTYPLLCLAAQYSERVYEPPAGRNEKDSHVDADWRMGTKAMVIKSVPMDYMNTIVFAIRGTATFMDWAVNLNMEPTSPTGFLDDPGNLCHAGFLSVARKMVFPVARRLRQLLEEDPGRASYSLLITGHSAGGAVAALLYSHMLATSKDAESELNLVSGCFKRIHCITFGTPPVSLIPLTKPDDYLRRRQLRHSLFLSFVNEGDPVTRADKAYVKSLLQLFSAPTPPAHSPKSEAAGNTGKKPRKSEKHKHSSQPSIFPSPKPKETTPRPSTTWPVPPCTLSNAGRIVVLRSGDPKARLKDREGSDGGKKKTTVEERLHEGVVAQVVTDEQLRGVVWGDPVAHMMRLYAGRVEVLAVGAVTGMGY